MGVERWEKRTSAATATAKKVAAAAIRSRDGVEEAGRSDAASCGAGSFGHDVERDLLRLGGGCDVELEAAGLGRLILLGNITFDRVARHIGWRFPAFDCHEVFARHEAVAGLERHSFELAARAEVGLGRPAGKALARLLRKEIDGPRSWRRATIEGDVAGDANGLGEVVPAAGEQ